MDEQSWLACTDPAAILRLLDPSNARIWKSSLPDPTPSARKLRLFACAICRSVWHLLTDERSRRAVEVAERFVDGEATAEEMEAARMATVPPRSSLLTACPSNYCCNQWSVRTAARETARFCEILAHENRPFNQNQSAMQADLLRDVVGNPFVPITIRERFKCSHGHAVFAPLKKDSFPVPLSVCLVCHEDGPPWEDVQKGRGPSWITPLVQGLAHAAYTERLPTGFLDPDHLAVLADALEDFGCDNLVLLAHLRGQIPCRFCSGKGEHQTGYVKCDVFGIHDSRQAFSCVACAGTGWVTPSEPAVHARGCFAVDAILGKE